MPLSIVRAIDALVMIMAILWISCFAASMYSFLVFSLAAYLALILGKKPSTGVSRLVELGMTYHINL
jgi:hypothetical protein